MPEKEKPKRKLPKKSQRPKRRYILFELENCSNSQKAFDLVMAQFSQDESKELGVWFIEFKPGSGKGIVRCRHNCVERVKKSLNAANGLKTLKTSGTLKALRAK